MSTLNYFYPFKNKKEMTIEFFRLAKILGLVKNNQYSAGIPKGKFKNVINFYKYENKLGYPRPQQLQMNK